MALLKIIGQQIIHGFVNMARWKAHHPAACLWMACALLLPFPAGAEEQAVVIQAGTIEHSKQQGITRAQEDVVIRSQGRIISGQEAEFNHVTNQGMMSGRVRMDDKDAVIDGDRVEFDLKTGGGKLFNAHGRLGPSFYFSGAKITRLGPDQYEIEDGSCSTCPFPDQDWRLEASAISVTAEEYAYITGMKLLIADYPVFYLPYFIIPAKTKRSTGFLIPAPGYSGRNGFNIKNQFFWAIADNMDATIGHNHRGSDGDGGELEFRYIFSEKTRGRFWAEYFFQNAAGETPAKELWKALYDHNQLLPLGVENVVKADFESKESIARRWEDDLSARSRRYSDSFFLLRKSWDSRSLNAMARTKRSVVPGEEQNIDELPTISFINQKESLFGLPLYWMAESSYSSFQTREKTGDAGEMVKWAVDRMDVYPGFSALLAPAPWISLEPEARYRATWYSKGADSQGATVDQAFTREYYALSMMMTGPRFFRIFDSGEGGKMKHLITPSLLWSYAPGYEFDGEDRKKVKPLDQVDLSPPAHGVTFTLTNQALFKESGQEGLERVTERIKLDIAQSYDFNEAARAETPDAPLKPLGAAAFSLRTLPADWLMVNLLGTYDHYGSRWDTTQVEVGYRLGSVFHLALDRVTAYPDQAWDTLYLELSTPWGGSVDFSGVYNEKAGYLNDGALRFSHNRGCWGFTISALYKKNALDASGAAPSSSEEFKVLFAINLLGVGDSIGEVAKPLAGRKL